MCRVVNVYHPQYSCGKVLFLHVYVILFTGGGVWQADIPRGRQTPRSLWRRPLQRTVRILLECILVYIVHAIRLLQGI